MRTAFYFEQVLIDLARVVGIESGTIRQIYSTGKKERVSLIFLSWIDAKLSIKLIKSKGTDFSCFWNANQLEPETYIDVYEPTTLYINAR